MNWIKKGKIFTPSTNSSWAYNHSQGPTPLDLTDRIRVYYASRPKPNLSLPTFLDIDKNDFKKILLVNETPIIGLGKPGTFDEFGIIPCDVKKINDLVYLYYTGWQRGINVPYTLSIGLAISEDNGLTFKKAYEGPILDRTKNEPYQTMAPFSLVEDGVWHLWYASGIGYPFIKGKYEPQYIIKYATSKNGIDWLQPNITCIFPLSKFESNTRPTVIKIGSIYHMWFSYRGLENYRGGDGSYKIGYACSSNLVSWTRDDKKAGIGLSEDAKDWDSETITYPYVIKVRDKYQMFYNGNGFGASGFGYSTLKENL